MTVMCSISNDHGHIARVGAWCWTESGRTAKVVHFVTFYAPLWGAIIFNRITYFQVIRMLNNATRVCTLNLFSIFCVLGLEFLAFKFVKPFVVLLRPYVSGYSDGSGYVRLSNPHKCTDRYEGIKPLGLVPTHSNTLLGFGTINRIHVLIEPGHKIYLLSVLDFGMAAHMGLFNSIAYGLNYSVRRAIHERLDLF